MGTERASKVYAAELQGLLLAMKMTQAETEPSSDCRHATIFADNQAAFRSLVWLEGRSGGHILKQIAQLLQLLEHSGHSVHVHCILSRRGLGDNKVADIAAEEAIG